MEKKGNTNKIIAGTLDYGLRNPNWVNIMLWVLVAFGWICLIIFTVATIVANELLLLLAATLFPLFFWSLGGYFLVRERRHNDLIKLWREDSVELVAYTERVYCESAMMRTYGRGGILLESKNNQPYILKVKVKYANQKHTYFSLTREKSSFDTFFLKSYSYHGKMVSEYGGGKVKILYSPRYGKVMFLSDEKPKVDEAAEIE